MLRLSVRRAQIFLSRNTGEIEARVLAVGFAAFRLPAV
jgi:hypothetical protein